MPGFPDKFMPFMDEDKFGALAARFMSASYGPFVRWGRKRNIKHKYDVEPAWRKRGKALTTGYQKHW
jgi:hydrogenase small subunit